MTGSSCGLGKDDRPMNTHSDRQRSKEIGWLT